MIQNQQATTKEVQQVLLELLVFIDKICKENKISYWIDGGTLLGAVRSSSFIGWDDDVDIALMYDDYLKLLECLSIIDQKEGDYILYDNHRDPIYWSSYFGSTKILKHKIYPVEIDIIPIKSIEKSIESETEDREIANIGRIYMMGDTKDPINQERLPKIINKKGKAEFFRNFRDHLKANTVISEKRQFSYAFNDMYVKKTRPYYSFDTIFPLSEIKFEGYNFPAPANCSAYLSVLYGEEFLIPPAIQNRIPSETDYIHNQNLSKETVASRLRLVYDMMSNLMLAKGNSKGILSKVRIVTASTYKWIASENIFNVSVLLRYVLKKI